MEGKLNAYATTMMGRPIMRTTTTHHTTTHHTTTHKDSPKQENKPIIITRNQGLNLWQWLRKYSK